MSYYRAPAACLSLPFLVVTVLVFVFVIPPPSLSSDLVVHLAVKLPPPPSFPAPSFCPHFQNNHEERLNPTRLDYAPATCQPECKVGEVRPVKQGSTPIVVAPVQHAALAMHARARMTVRGADCGRQHSIYA